MTLQARSPPANTVVSIIDDDASIREATESLVRSFGYDARTFASAEDYLQAGGTVSSCLIVDVQMPGMSGPDLQQRLLERGDNTPIIFITAFTQDSMRRRVLTAGAYGYLTKPINDAEFSGCLDRALSAH